MPKPLIPCPKCKGRHCWYEERDHYGTSYACVYCGYSSDALIVPQEILQTLEKFETSNRKGKRQRESMYA